MVRGDGLHTSCENFARIAGLIACGDRSNLPAVGGEAGVDRQHDHEYDAFISYRRSDGTRAAQRLRKMLRAHRLPRSLRADRKERLTIFLDTVYERGASDFYEKTIRPALMASRYLVVVATPDAVRRPEGEDWIAREVADFSSGPHAGNIIVVRAIGDFDDTMPADIAERYPHVQIVDMRDSGWFASLLPQRASRIADEKLKIVGPLFDIPLEQMPVLRREEERQQIGRAGMLTGAGAAVAVMVVGLSLYALASQWRGQQAMRDSFNITENTVLTIVTQSGASETIPSASREIILQNCDVAGRLAAATGVKATPAMRAACEIEEAFAVAVADDRAAGADRIAEVLDRAAEEIPEQGPVDSGLTAVLRTGYASWLALRNSLPDAELRAGAEKLAALERDLATRVTWREQEAEAYRRAYDAVILAAGELERKGRKEEAAQAYGVARKDAGAAIEAALKPGAEAVPEGRQGPVWAELAWMYYVAASNEATALSRSEKAQEGRQALDDAQAIYRNAPASAAPATVHSALAHLNLFRAAWETNQPDGAPDERLWECLAEAKAALDIVGTGDEAEETAQTRESCADMLSERILDAAGNVTGQGEGDPSAALRAAADDALRLAAYRPADDAWGQLLPLVILDDLAAAHERQGRGEEAEAARIEAARLYKPFNGSMDTGSISAARVEAINGAWQRIWNGHYARTDGYRNAANKSANPEEAVMLLRRLLAEDDAWDSMMAGLSHWDHVYQADVRLQLADLLAAQGDHAGAEAEMSEAYSRIARFEGTFDLSGDFLVRANAAWSRLAGWKNASAPGELVEAQRDAVP